MSTIPDSQLRNRSVSKQLDVGRRNSDASSSTAADPAEAVESPIHTFAQSPTSADRLRHHQGPLDELLGPQTHPEQNPAADSAAGINIEELQAELLDAGYSPGTIDGNFGPKTLEALNLFQQDQVDALKLQNNNLLTPASRLAPDSLSQSAARQSAAGLRPDQVHLSSLANPSAKTVSSTEKTESFNSGMSNKTLNNEDK